METPGEEMVEFVRWARERGLRIGPKPQSEWDIFDWQYHAKELSTKIKRLEEEIAALRKKHSRKPPMTIEQWHTHVRKSGFYVFASEGNQPRFTRPAEGRPRNEEARARAAAAYAVRLELEAREGRRVSNLKALATWYGRLNKRADRAGGDSAALSFMKKIHTQARRSKPRQVT